MIEITYEKQANTLTVTGHAGAGRKGEDIVCAAVSALVLTLAENLRDLHRTGTAKSCFIDVRQGAAELRCVPTRGLEAVVQCIFGAICCGFELVQQMHPKYVRYQER